MAVVLGHEISHVDLRHNLAVVEYLRKLNLPEDDQIAQLAVFLARMPYSSKVEEEADRVGAELIHKVGYSVFQAVEFFASLPTSTKKTNSTIDDLLTLDVDVIADELEALFSTHPDSRKRACLFKQKAFELHQMQSVDPSYVGSTNFRQKIPMSDKKY